MRHSCEAHSELPADEATRLTASYDDHGSYDTYGEPRDIELKAIHDAHKLKKK